MNKDKQKTEVIFRKFKGEILALFPHIIWDYSGDVTCYAHLGQHGSADYKYVISNSKPINKPEGRGLYSELESIGYNLKPVKRQNYNKYWENKYEFEGLIINKVL